MHACSVSDSLQPNGPEPSSVHGILQAQKQYLKFFTSLYICVFSDGSKALSLALTSPSLQSERQTSGRCPTVTPTSEALVNWLSETLFMDLSFMHWRRKRQATPVLLPGESQGRAAVYGVAQGRTRRKGSAAAAAAGGPAAKSPPDNAGRTGLIPGLRPPHRPRGNEACVPRRRSLCAPGPLCSERSRRNEKPTQVRLASRPRSPNQRRHTRSSEGPALPKAKEHIKDLGSYL